MANHHLEQSSIESIKQAKQQSRLNKSIKREQDLLIELKKKDEILDKLVHQNATLVNSTPPGFNTL